MNQPSDFWKIGDIVDYLGRITGSSAPSLESDPADIVLTESARWFCAIVKPSCHGKVEVGLQRLGFRTFYPRTRKWASHARTKKAVERPILGRYVFVEIDHPRQSFSAVRSIHEVDDIVSNLGSPTPFPARWVESLLHRYMAGEFDEIKDGKVPVGARIRVMEGEFHNMLATVVSTKGNRVDFKLMGENRIERTHQNNVRAA